MSSEPLIFARDYDLPRTIVWDAFVDEVLVEGWLAVARLDPRQGGSYRLDWRGPQEGSTRAVIAAFEPRARLALEDGSDILDFRLAEIAGGTRGSGTRVTVGVTGFGDDGIEKTALWTSRLEQLEQLLRGHPVDWENWQRDRGEAWRNTLREAAESGLADGA